MATILKSNTVVNNPDREFKYYTKRGITDKALSDFLTGMESVGYDLTDAEYQAVKVFKDNLITADVWDKIYEVYPLMGNSLESAGVKLKSVSNPVLTPVDGLNISHFQTVGGKIVGKSALVTPRYTGNAPRFDTNLKFSELPNRHAGFHVYCGNAPVGDTHFSQPVMGALLGKNNEQSQLVATLGVNVFASQYVARILTQAGAPTNGFSNGLGLLSYVSRPQVIDVSAKGVLYRAGVKIGEGAIALLESKDSYNADTTLGFLGHNKPIGSTAATTGYSGAVRFGCITSGFMTDEDITTLNTEVVALMTKLGKVAV